MPSVNEFEKKYLFMNKFICKKKSEYIFFIFLNYKYFYNSNISINIQILNIYKRCL